MTKDNKEHARQLIAHAQRSYTRHLSLRSLHLTTLPSSLWSLTHIWSLELDANDLTDLPDEIGHLVQLTFLTLSKNALVNLPESIARLRNLLILDLSSNQLTEVPKSVAHLSALRTLDLSNNAISHLPEAFYLPSLSRLSLAGNRLKLLPPSLRHHPTLQYLNLEGNSRLRLPPELSASSGGKLGSASVILDYYFQQGPLQPLNEAKMILVGRGGVGKTSLVNRLVHNRFDLHESKTDGISITPWQLPLARENVRLNIWDFGGQEIMHATHQFFLTKRSLYLLVLSAREGEQDANIDYWMRLIEGLGGGSPVLVVINKISEHALDLNRRGLRDKFPSIKGFHETDCLNGAGLETLCSAIQAETDQLDHLRDPIPEPWVKVKDLLRDLPRSEGKSYIPLARYQQICVSHGITDASDQHLLLGFLHDLGIVVNFRDDPRLAETHVLDPGWVTNGIYSILNAPLLASRRGELDFADLSTLLDGVLYPRHMYVYLLDLMRKFELCYQIYEAEGHYLVPELLGKEQPDLSAFAGADALRLEVMYDVLPEGLIPRFIVRSRALNRELPRWRTGVILQWEGSEAVVHGDPQDRVIAIAVTGEADGGRTRLLSVIRADLDHIHRSLPSVNPDERVPVPGHKGLTVGYKELRARRRAGETCMKLFTTEGFVEVVISDLLEGIEEIPVRRRRRGRDAGVNVVFCYSHRDEQLRDELETHLKLLRRQRILNTWHDRKILAGGLWERAIDEKFRQADVVLLLVSADFLASDYCYDVELELALEREGRGETRVVPIILRACDWKSAPFARLQALPENARPVTSWPNRDEAWESVSRGIRALAERAGFMRPEPAQSTATNPHEELPRSTEWLGPKD